MTTANTESTTDESNTKELTLQATIEHDRLSEFVNAIDAIADESKIRIDEAGISSRAVDPANVAMVDAQLPAEAFEEFTAEESAIGVNVRRISNLLEYLEGEGPVTLTLSEQSKKLILEAGDFSYTYSYHAPDTIRTEPDLPEMDLSATVEIETDRFRSAVDYFSSFAERVTVGYSAADNEFYMEGMEKRGTGDGEFRVPRHDLVDVRRAGNAHSVFNLDYFWDITTALPENNTATIEIGEEFPMMLSFGIAWDDLIGDYLGDVEFLQAPRLQSD